MARMARTSQQDLQYGTMLTNHALHNPEIFCLAFFSLSAFSLLFQTTVLWKIFSWVPKVDFIRRFSSGSSRIPPISAAHMLDRLLVFFFFSLWLVYSSQSHRFTSPWAKQLSWRLTWNRSDTPVLLRSSTNIKLDKLSFATIIISAFLFRSVFIFFFFFFLQLYISRLSSFLQFCLLRIFFCKMFLLQSGRHRCAMETSKVHFPQSLLVCLFVGTKGLSVWMTEPISILLWPQFGQLRYQWWLLFFFFLLVLMRTWYTLILDWKEECPICSLCTFVKESYKTRGWGWIFGE